MKTKCVFLVILLLGVALLLDLPCQASGQTAEGQQKGQVAASPESPTKTDATNVHMKKIDAAGERIGRGIESFSEKASHHVGSWIKAEVGFGISWLELVVFAFLLLIVVVVERILRWTIQAQIHRLPSDSQAISWKKLLFTSLSRPLSLFIWAYGIYAALSPLLVHFQTPEGPNLVRDIARKAADIAGSFAILWFIYRLVDVVDVQLRKWAAVSRSTIDDMLAPLVGRTLRVFIVMIGGIIIIQNVTGVKIGPLLASLGIGGLAIAFAAKDSIANFFGTVTILFDKPFQVGERIVIDNYDGVVESVGFRSSRLRTLAGHLVTIPNDRVVNSSVENIGLRPHIKWVTNIGITYDTPPEKAEKAVQIIRDLLENHEGIKEDFPPRVFFNGFNDWSLNIMVIAWYHPPDYWAYQAWLQKTCLEIMNRFQAEGIEFAFPSRTIYMANDDKRQLKLQLMGEKGPV